MADGGGSGRGIGLRSPFAPVRRAPRWGRAASGPARCRRSDAGGHRLARDHRLTFAVRERPGVVRPARLRRGWPGEDRLHSGEPQQRQCRKAVRDVLWRPVRALGQDAPCDPLSFYDWRRPVQDAALGLARELRAEALLGEGEPFRDELDDRAIGMPSARAIPTARTSIRIVRSIAASLAWGSASRSTPRSRGTDRREPEPIILPPVARHKARKQS
jgi:hypothetical protein